MAVLFFPFSLPFWLGMSHLLFLGFQFFMWGGTQGLSGSLVSAELDFLISRLLTSHPDLQN